MFDIYGNKNGDWGQSEFSFTWSLRDGSDADRTSLLSATTSQNVSFEVPADASIGETYTATLTVAGDYGLAGSPAEISVVVADTVGNVPCASCHSDVNTTYQNTAHSLFSVNCENCHGPGSLHGGSPANITKTNWPNWVTASPSAPRRRPGRSRGRLSWTCRFPAMRPFRNSRPAVFSIGSPVTAWPGRHRFR